MALFIWDASNYDWQRDADHSINFAAVRRDGISGVQHKATEGHTYTDPHFGDFARLVNQGLGFALVGPYHVLWPGDPQADADHWFDTVEQLMPWWRDYPGVVNWQIDAEKFTNMPRQPNLAEIHACAARIMQRGGNDLPPEAVVVYAPKWLYGNTLTGLKYKLWSSDYGTNPAVRYRQAYPGDNGPGWGAYSGVTPTLWQYGSRTIIGEQSTCDASAVRVNSEADLQALFRNDPPEDMTIVDAATKTYLDQQFAAIGTAIGVVIRGDDPDPKTGDTHPDNIQRTRQDIAQLAAQLAALQSAVSQLGAGGSIDYGKVEQAAEAALAKLKVVVTP